MIDGTSNIRDVRNEPKEFVHRNLVMLRCTIICLSGGVDVRIF